MASSRNDKNVSSRPATRSFSTGSDRDVIVIGANLPNSATVSSEHSFSDPVSNSLPQSKQPSKKRGGRKVTTKAPILAAAADPGFFPVQDSQEDLEVWCCKICKVNFSNSNDKLMQCERCEGATCTSCLNIDNNLYELLTGRIDLHWYCSECDKQAMTAIKAEFEIEERCSAYMETMTKRLDKMQDDIDLKADKATVDNLCADMISTESKLKGANEDIAKLADRLDLMYQEADEIEKRRKNLVIRGLPEHVKPRKENDKSDDENISKQADLKACGELIKSLGFNDMKLSTVHRLGKPNPDGKPRPLKMMLDSEDDKSQLLRSGPKLRHVDPELVSFNPKTVFICPDMTILQREADVKLRDDLRKKRIEDPNWIIKGKKLFLRKTPPPHPPEGKDGATRK